MEAVLQKVDKDTGLPDFKKWDALNVDYERANKTWYTQDALVNATKAVLATETANKTARDNATKAAADKVTADAAKAKRLTDLNKAKKDVTDEKKKLSDNAKAIKDAKDAMEANKANKSGNAYKNAEAAKIAAEAKTAGINTKIANFEKEEKKKLAE